MLQNTKELYGHTLAALDGDVGHVKDFYFDDKTWVIRYLVADTGTWLTGRQVLLSPHSFGMIDHHEKTLHLKLLKKQIENSPSIESDRPVSRQYEEDYYSYFGWPAYWEGGAMWGTGGYPVAMAMPETTLDKLARHAHDRPDDPHLRSTKDVTGYHIQATDGVLGSVSGFMVNERNWAIADMVAETGHWYAGKEILIPAAKIKHISYEDSKVFVNLTIADLKRTAEDHVAAAVA